MSDTTNYLVDRLFAWRDRAERAEAALVELTAVLDITSERAITEVVRLRAALATMIDWHERGDQDTDEDSAARFSADLRGARAALARLDEDSTEE